MDSYNSSVEIYRSDHKSTIFRVYPDFPIRLYNPGQYGSLGLMSESGNKLVKRAYSISSSIIDINTNEIFNNRDHSYLEFYINRIPLLNDKKEQITPKLFSLKDGDRLFCGEKIVGHYIFDDKDKWKNILFVSTHTGESPNNSIINKLLLENRNLNICNINTGPKWKSLYSREHKLLQKLYKNYRFIQFKDDSKNYNELSNFISDFTSNNKEVNKIVGFRFNKDNTSFMLCGDPKMIGAPIKKGAWQYVTPRYGLINVLAKRSLELTTKFNQGSIVYESYW